MNRSKKQDCTPQMAKLRRKAFPPMEKNAQPSQIESNSILCSSPSHTRGVNSLSPRSSRPLLSHRFSAHPPAQQLSPHKGLAEATQAEKKKREGSSQGEGNRTWTARHACVRHLRCLRAAPRSGHPMPSSTNLRAQQQRGSRYTP